MSTTDSAPKPRVVVYGASGYTGRLICEYLRELAVPFLALGRDQERTAGVVEAIPGIDTVAHETKAVTHDVASLTAAFEGAKVICNTVGPFAEFGHEVAEAALAVGAHYLDTTGEQDWILSAEERWGAKYEEAGLALVPGLAQMYTNGEIAAQIALEEPGLDTLDILVLWKGAPTTASTETIFTNLLSEAHFLEDNEYVGWGPIQPIEVAVPGRHDLALSLPWGGTSHPVWFKNDPRVHTVKATGGVYNRQLMEGVAAMAAEIEKTIKPLPLEEAKKQLAAIAEQQRAPMPPRERQTYHRSLDSVHASGPLGRAHVVLRGNQNYKQTALEQAYGARHLLQAKPYKTGLASGCQAFGHRELLGVLQQFGLMGRPEIVRYA